MIESHELTAAAARIADILRAPRRGLDSTIAELAILLGELCETTDDAEALTATLTTHYRGRWDYPEVAKLCRKLAKAAASPETPADSPEWVEAAVRRLCILPAADLDGLIDAAEIRAELTHVITTGSHSPGHAHRAIESLLLTEHGKTRWRPTPAEVQAALAETPKEPPPKLYPADPKCRECHGTGSVFHEQAYLHPIWNIWYSGSKTCACRKSPK